MIGSSKIDETTNDLQRLQDLFDLGLTNSEIARIYRTNSGESISRIHVSSIRRGKRWNFDNRSFIMKHELESNDIIESKIGDDVIKSIIAPLITDTSIYYIFLSYMNSTPITDSKAPFMLKKPFRTDLIQHHTNLINKLY
jgi:hypothetical protein